MCEMGVQIGDKAPEFSGMAVCDNEYRRLSLSDYEGRWLVLFFYPGDWTFVCPTEIRAFSERCEEFTKENGCDVIACSTDSHFCHQAWMKRKKQYGGLGKVNIPLLSDQNHSIADAYGVLKKDEGVAYRGTFIIDDKGVLQHASVNSMSVGRSVDEVLRLVQAFQHVASGSGELCQINWKPGDKGLNPDSLPGPSPSNGHNDE